MTTEHSWKYDVFLPKPTWCDICHKFITGLTAGMQKAATCSQCKMAAHKSCCPTHSKCSKTPNPDNKEKEGDSKEPVIKALAEAVYDFPPENERELKLARGDKVEVFQISGEWWYGAIVLPNGQPGSEGFFPGSYVKKIGQWELAPAE